MAKTKPTKPAPAPFPPKGGKSAPPKGAKKGKGC
jgi:hypothetical protein